MIDKLKAYGMQALAVLLLAALAAQTWRLHNAQIDLSVITAKEATGRADRAQAWARDSATTATKEQAHAASTQGASDAFTQTQPARDDSLRADLARAERLRIGAEQRAATYRAQATASAAACSGVADRAAALDGLVAEVAGLVAEGRGIVNRRDAEIVLLRGVIDADRALLAQ